MLIYCGLKVHPKHTKMNKDDFFVNNITSAEIIGEQTVQNAKENGFKVLLTFEKITGKHLQPIGLSKAIDTIIGSVVLAKCLGQGRVLIVVKTTQDKRNERTKDHIQRDWSRKRGNIWNSNIYNH